MEKIPPFNAQKLEAACKVLADTERGLTGSEIGYLLQDCRINDVSQGMTKWKRLFNALVKMQNQHQVGNHLIMFINRALDPVGYARNKEKFSWRRNELNVILSFSGFAVREDGKVIHTPKETTLKGARARAGALKSALEDRNTHSEVFKYGSPYKAVQVWKYYPILLCKHLIFHYVLPEDMISNLLKLLTRTVL